MRASRKWQHYDTLGKLTHLSQALAIVEADSHGCFWG
ncbi:MAG: DUF3024 domain-containing protein [Lewinella sp.]